MEYTIQCKQGNPSGVSYEGEGDVAGEGRLFGEQKFYSQGIGAPCMTLTIMHSD